jgi:hypothetical protein
MAAYFGWSRYARAVSIHHVIIRSKSKYSDMMEELVTQKKGKIYHYFKPIFLTHDISDDCICFHHDLAKKPSEGYASCIKEANGIKRGKGISIESDTSFKYGCIGSFGQVLFNEPILACIMKFPPNTVNKTSCKPLLPLLQAELVATVC